MREELDLVPMIKPQFELGRNVGSGGVVRDPQRRVEAVLRVVRFAAECGLGLRAITASPLPGPSGNVEYFAWLRADAPTGEEHVEALVADAVREGPQSSPTGGSKRGTDSSRRGTQRGGSA